VIDPIAPRYTALSRESAVPVHVVDAKEVHADAAKHPKVNDVEIALLLLFGRHPV